jgi:hypothetical protein
MLETYEQEQGLLTRHSHMATSKNHSLLSVLAGWKIPLAENRFLQIPIYIYIYICVLSILYINIIKKKPSVYKIRNNIKNQFILEGACQLKTEASTPSVE